MKEYLNCGVYEVDLQGTTDASFQGAHPSIIIQKLTEPTFYFIIPFTTYTKEKWDNLRKYGCCKISSANSIARIDKMQIREKVDIPKRYVKKGKYIVPTYDEILKIIEKAKEYFILSADKASRYYQKYYLQYELLEKDWNTYISFKSVENTNFAIETTDPLVLIYPLRLIKNLTSDDIINVLKNDTFHFRISYNYSEKNLQIKLSKKP